MSREPDTHNAQETRRILDRLVATRYPLTVAKDQARLTL